MTDTPFFKNLKHGLLPERRRVRFAQELAAHAEDAGTTEHLGDPHILRETFHAATHARRTLIIGILFSLFVCWCTYTINFDETPLEQNLFIGYSMLFGFLFIIPIAPFLLYLVVFPLYYVYGSSSFEWYFRVLPFFSSFIWTSFYFLWNYGPPKCLEWPRSESTSHSE